MNKNSVRTAREKACDCVIAGLPTERLAVCLPCREPKGYLPPLAAVKKRGEAFLIEI